ncbi:lysozyme protein (macronuclear) [Tetrahymena thermophila SB210]|uniref:Lysozyme protein n=1 Tax=Tetrahymena thermophila (strain SB210) TaxID=312017 RepID=Q23YF8_TETTS|nr:lysozyme protein [Tetrahymena thermophila SB210]EAS01575.1 lysozyme protein [Tetrahymena thermophila SB210]|eukprot:XP_001021820.1 lysozyme protein [Tetrahymena thermophila SB210]
MNKIILLTLVVLSLLLATEARFEEPFFGFTQNQPLEEEEFQCLRDTTYYFIQTITGNDPQTVYQARMASFSGLDTQLIYIPCINKDTDSYPESRVTDQVKTFLKTVHQVSCQVIWIQISVNDDEKCKWTDDIDFNCQRTKEIANYLKATANKNIGFFSSQEDWIKIFGSSEGCSSVSDKKNFYPLYYKHLDGQPNTHDYKDHKFGSFENPAMKMYLSTEECNIKFNANVYYPQYLHIYDY